MFANLLTGNSGYCFHPSLPPYRINITDCAKLNGTWLSYDINFDNILQSMISLFVLSTLEGWPEYMYQVIDGGKQDTGPIRDNNTFVSILFIVFIFIGSIFCMNLFIAIVSMNFHIA
jgi:hypothetical protein